MYRLMKSEKYTLDHSVSGPMSSYLHIQLNQFPQLDAALVACQIANAESGRCHYVLNASGKEYYEGVWID